MHYCTTHALLRYAEALVIAKFKIYQCILMTGFANFNACVTQELQRRREEEVTTLQEQLADLTSKLEQLELNMKKYTASMAQMGELQRQREAENKEEEEAYKVRKRTYDLLPNADENIAKLQVSVCSTKKMYQWMEVRNHTCSNLSLSS